MNTQTILDKFEAVSTTIHVVEKDGGDYFTFNEFGVVPVKCIIKYLWKPEMEVQDTIFVDSVTLDTSDDTITFNLKDNVQEMLSPDEIISLEIIKISHNQYLNAIKEDEDLHGFFD